MNSKSAKGTDELSMMEGGPGAGFQPVAIIRPAGYRLPSFALIYHSHPSLRCNHGQLTMSAAMSDSSTPAQEAASASIDSQQLQQNQPIQSPTSASNTERKRERNETPSQQYYPHHVIFIAKAPSVRRACVACHTGKTRCSEVLPCQVRLHFNL